MRNLAIKLRYDGTAYHGWQVQKSEISVAETLEKALSKVCGERIKLTGCGRTDAGVHALSYCANFRTESRIPVDRLQLKMALKSSGASQASRTAMSSGRRLFTASGSLSTGIRLSVRKLAQ